MQPLQNIVLVIFAAFMVSSCAGPRPSDVDAELPSLFPHHSADQVMNMLGPVPASIGGLYAKTSIRVQSPDQHGGFNANIFHRRDDSLYMSVRAALGIEAARALVTVDSFFVYDRIKKKLYFGHLDQADGHLPIPVSTRGIMGDLLGFLIPDRTVIWDISADSDKYYLSNPQTGETYTIDPSIWRVTDYVRSDNDRILEYRRYSDFKRMDTFVIPQRIEFGHPENSTLASVRYRRVDINPERLDFNFRVSDSAQRIPVE